MGQKGEASDEVGGGKPWHNEDRETSPGQKGGGKPWHNEGQETCAGHNAHTPPTLTFGPDLALRRELDFQIMRAALHFSAFKCSESGVLGQDLEPRHH